MKIDFVIWTIIEPISLVILCLSSVDNLFNLQNYKNKLKMLPTKMCDPKAISHRCLIQPI